MPAIAARDGAELTTAVQDIHATVVATDFVGRAGALAATLARERTDVVGLQEVARWTVTGPRAAPADDLDFLRLLETVLSRRGVPYDVAAVAHNADIRDIPFGKATLDLRNRADGTARAAAQWLRRSPRR